MAMVPERIRVRLNMKFIEVFWHQSANLTGSSLVGLALAGMAAPALAQYTQQPQQPEAQAATQPPGGTTAPLGVQQIGNADTEAGTAPRRAWSIVPRVTVGETITDNVAPASGNKRGDQITDISPGIHITGNSARAKLYLDYQLHKFLYAQESGQHRSQNSLNAFGTFEAIEKWMFIDVSGVIAQQDISPFGVQTPGSASINNNRTETSNFKVSPYFRGKLAGYADYELRYNRSTANAKSAVASDVDTAEWTGKIGGGTLLSNLDWSVDASRKDVDYSLGRKSEEEYARGLLSYKFGPQFKISFSAGQESNDYASLNKESRNTHGYGFDWAPTERTQVSAFRERRFFGNAHTFSFNHRTPRSAWRFTDSRAVAAQTNRFATVGLGTYYDLLFSQLASQVPDPNERAEVVNSLLQALTIPPDAQVTSGFLNARVSVQRQQELSFLLHGTRNVLTFAARRSEQRAIGASTGPGDAFDISQTVRQRGFNVNLSHRLSAFSTLAVSASQQNSSGSGSGGISTKQRTLTTNFSTKLGPNTTASLGARRTIFDSTTSPYSENALLGTLTAQF